MTISREIFGARAQIYMKYNGKMNELANVISNGLLLPEFILEKSEYPPYNLSGSCEVMGFELWLEMSDISEFPYFLKLETELCTKEIFDDKMYDLSLWLARYVSTICKIDSLVLTQDSELSNQLFRNGEMFIHEVED